jgi:hypothetical protein
MLDSRHSRAVYLLFSAPWLVQTPNRIGWGTSCLAISYVDFLGLGRISAQHCNSESVRRRHLRGCGLLRTITDAFRYVHLKPHETWLKLIYDIWTSFFGGGDVSSLNFDFDYPIDWRGLGSFSLSIGMLTIILLAWQSMRDVLRPSKLWSTWMPSEQLPTLFYSGGAANRQDGWYIDIINYCRALKCTGSSRLCIVAIGKYSVRVMLHTIQGTTVW